MNTLYTIHSLYQKLQEVDPGQRGLTNTQVSEIVATILDKKQKAVKGYTRVLLNRLRHAGRAVSVKRGVTKWV